MKKVTKIIVTISIIAGLFAITGSVLSNNKKKNEAKTALVAQTNSAIAVKAETAKELPMEMNFVANGKFAPIQELEFSSETSGRVINVLVKEGSYVRKGQTLAIIKTENLEVDVQSAKEAYAAALKDKQRYENAYTTGGVTKQQVDQAELNLKNAEARVKQAGIRVTDANLRASINGIINKRMIEPGSVLAPGTRLFEIVDVSKLTLDIAISESQVAMIQPGNKVSISVGVLPGKQFEGKVNFIAAKADESLNFPVKIEVENNTENAIKAGMFGTATFEFPQQNSAILISRSAFIGSVNSNEIFVVNNGKAELRKVVAGRTLGDKVEILQGLNSGEMVITTGQINLVNGTAVSIIQ